MHFIASVVSISTGKAKITVLQLRGVAKLWWKSHVQIRQRQDQPITWAEFRIATEKRYCSPHYYMEKNMEFYNFKQIQEGKHSLSVNEYKEKSLRLHKYTPEVIGEALTHKFVEGLRKIFSI